MSKKVIAGIGALGLLLAPIWKSPYNRQPSSLAGMIYDVVRKGTPPHVRVEEATRNAKARTYLGTAETFLSFTTEGAALSRTIGSCGVLVDLGCGGGKWGPCLASACDYLIGVDADMEKLEKAAKKGVYNELIWEDVREYNPPPSSCVSMCQVIEHLEKEEGMELLRKLDSVCSRIALTTPASFRPSDTGLMAHRSLWKVEDFLALGFRTVLLRNWDKILAWRFNEEETLRLYRAGDSRNGSSFRPDMALRS